MKRFRIKRKNEKWVSNNRVLLGSSKKDPGRNPNFDTEETKLLISLWGDPTVQKTLITTHRKHTVIAKLAEQMNEYGYNRSTDEINTRIKNLKCFYNRLKKDMEVGSINVVTWKHFGAMDEIMTRSIFSVRPNEIPKPSLKYQLEQELEEKRKKCKNEGSNFNGTESSNYFQISEENISCSSMSSKEDNDIHKNLDESMVCVEKIDSFCKAKEEETSNIYKTEIEEIPLIIPKEEPVEEDVQVITDEINKSPESQVPVPNEYIQETNNFLKTAQASAAVPQSILIANQPTNGVSSQGKISLVPTNFLLQQNNKPQSQQIQIRTQPQQRIICTKPKNQANTSAGNGRMKVLFVNAFKNGNTTTVSAHNEFPLTNPSTISTSKTHQTEPVISMNYIEQPKPQRVEEQDVNIKDHGYEFLFNKLIDMQKENNEIQRQHLELAQQRLEFEKSMANKLLEALVSLKPVQTKESRTISNYRKRNANSEDQISEKLIIPDIIDDLNNYHLLTPKVEKID